MSLAGSAFPGGVSRPSSTRWRTSASAAAYLAELLDRFGSQELALAAYNIGPTRLARRLARGDVRNPAFVSRVLLEYQGLQREFALHRDRDRRLDFPAEGPRRFEESPHDPVRLRPLHHRRGLRRRASQPRRFLPGRPGGRRRGHLPGRDLRQRGLRSQEALRLRLSLPRGLRGRRGLRLEHRRAPPLRLEDAAREQEQGDPAAEWRLRATSGRRPESSASRAAPRLA